MSMIHSHASEHFSRTIINVNISIKMVYVLSSIIIIKILPNKLYLFLFFYNFYKQQYTKNILILKLIV